MKRDKELKSVRDKDEKEKVSEKWKKKERVRGITFFFQFLFHLFIVKTLLRLKVTRETKMPIEKIGTMIFDDR